MKTTQCASISSRDVKVVAPSTEARRMHPSPIRFLVACLTILVGASSGEDGARAAGLLKPVDGGAPLAIESHLVHVDISNGIAATEITQVFRNDGVQPLEAVYSFPLPPEASLAGFSMWINGEEVTGEVLERTRARDIYEEIVHPHVETEQDVRWNQWKQARRDPGLVEEVSYREFQVTVFPVPAQGTQQVRLLYYQYLKADEDLVTYVYPMETRVAEDSTARGRFSLDLTLRSAVPISGYSFPGDLEDQVTGEVFDAGRMNAYLDRQDGDLDRDFVMVYRLGREEAGLDLVAYEAPGEPGFFMALLTAPTEGGAAGTPVEAVETAPVDYTFVVDVSGSMRRRRRLEIAGEALSRFLEDCRPVDRFNVVAFNVTPQALSIEPLANDAIARDGLRDFLGRFPGVGGTDLYPALELAYARSEAGRRHAIVVVSDGGLNDLDEDHERFLRLAHGQNATIFGLALGNDANVPLLQALAVETGGFMTQISSRDDLARRGMLLRDRMRQEPFRNLRLATLGDIELLDVVPARIPDLYPGQQMAILGRYRGGGVASFRVHATRELLPVVFETTARLSGEERQNPEIRRLWAERKAFDLLQAYRAGRLPKEIKNTVVSLGVSYSIVTPLTSFLVLESEEMFREYGVERRTHALLEEESRAREERARASDARGADPTRVGPEKEPHGRHPVESLAGAVDPFQLLLIALVVAGPWILRRFSS